MIDQFILYGCIAGAIAMWLVASQRYNAMQAERQREIAQRGTSCQGRVIAVQRPFLLGSSTRLYFEYTPAGVERVICSCHIERRTADTCTMPLPGPGMCVDVQYLPELPHEAVIARLI